VKIVKQLPTLIALHMRSKENSKKHPEACHHKNKNKIQKLICIVAAARRLAYLDFHFCFLFQKKKKESNEKVNMISK